MDQPEELPKQSYASHIEALRRELEKLSEFRKIAEMDLVTARQRLEEIDGRIAFRKKSIRELELLQGGGSIAQETGTNYERWDLIDAVIDYLKEAGGGPAKIAKEVLPAILRGGAKTRKGKGTSPDYRVLCTAISMNAKKGRVVYNKDADTVALKK